MSHMIVLRPEYAEYLAARITELYPVHNPSEVLNLYQQAAATDKEFETDVVAHIKQHNNKVDATFLAYALFAKEHRSELESIVRSNSAVASSGGSTLLN